MIGSVGLMTGTGRWPRVRALVRSGRAIAPVRSLRLAPLVVAAAACALGEPGLPAPAWAAVGQGSAGQGTAASAPGAWMAVTPGATPYNLILLSLDTTRFDRLSCYGFNKTTSPNLDRLAADGILFEGTRSPVPVTLPAHATMLTGLYPFEHGVRNNGSYVVAPEAVTLPELLKKHGYATGAVLGGFPLDKRFGLNQGFDAYDDEFPVESVYREVDLAQRTAADVSRLGLAWLDRQKGGPFFLWCHYYDPHAPYRPPDPYKTMFANDRYAGEIASMDAEIGKLLDGVRSRGLMDRTVIVVAGDHGEGLDEHGEHTHMIFIYETTQHVPMLIRLPAAGAFAGREWRGSRVEGLTNLVDILPTVWNSLGLPREELPPVSGISLLPVVTGKAPAHRWVYHESLVADLEYGASELRGYQDKRWKYIRAPRPELYDLQNDPKELKNLAGREGDRMRAMEASLDSLLRREPGARAPVAMDAETIEKLRSLGYVAGGAAPSTGGSKPDPKEMNWAIEAVLNAGTLAASYRPADALRAIDSVLAVYPKIPTAQRLRGTCLTRLGRGADAVKAYDQAMADCGGCAEAPRLKQERLSALVSAGRNREALKDVEALLKENPKEQGRNLIHGEILNALGNAEGARQAFVREAGFYPRDPAPLVKLGILETGRKRPVEAEKAYRKALEINPRDVDALVMLSELMDNLNRSAEASALTEKAIAADPDHPGALMRRAFDQQRKGQLDQALASYQGCLARQPGNAAALFNLGTLFGQMGRNAEAERAYQNAIATDKAPQGAYANLGVLLASRGKIPDAVKIWEEGLQREPDGSGAAAIRSNLARARSMK